MNNETKNNLTAFNFLFLWFGAAISIAEIMTGSLIAPLGFKTGFLVILLGHAIGTAILVLGGVIGTEERIPAIMSTRISFGSYGSYLFSILNVLQLIGWTAVMIISGGRSINIISKTLWSFDSINFWSIVIGLLVCLWIVSGSAGFKKINTAAVFLLLILTIVLSFIVFKNGELFTKQATGNMSFGGALELNIVMPLSWLPLIADYTRFAKSKKGAVSGSFIGYFVASSWMYLVGLGAAILFENPDVGAIMTAANLGFAALGIIVLATVTTTFMDVYSAGVTFLNIMPNLNEKTVSVIMGVIGTIVAIVVPIEQYESFLYAIGSVFAPLFAILFTDYFIIKKRTRIQDNLIIDWGAMIVWIIGVVLYYILIKFDFILGSTVPVMILTSLIYILSWRWIENWKYLRKSQNSYQG
ncbi:putative hydroxymethylpyrimidine transporter CytX [Fonticella tunisiensis]|uniref:Putative hydroxymethylpyrimidine transporter CytX n=1 Tax=Fonticella tunisiensis TaxID=1096341 RepID=A0A4R7KL38_9CLOT|nr:putative hydroxymethylpyrimidine transporter CytX [Fonticella tunisiensis]TDT57271.1 putative hydroxymethylpyrimidine transporter CytX [Fonticella tunisiensis]